MRYLIGLGVLFLGGMAPAIAHPTFSQPIAGDSAVIYRLAWVEPGLTMRSGAVVVNGDHLAGEIAGDRAVVALTYRGLARRYRVGAVVNLRAECEEDSEGARVAGMDYLHLRIPDGRVPDPAQVSRFFGFLRAERDRGRVVLWHCAGGIGRAGVFAAMLRVREGWSVQDAATEMFRMGLSYAQASEDLPALNSFAQALGRSPYFPNDWRQSRRSPYDYAAIVPGLPRFP